jgi:hypothetical protein
VRVVPDITVPDALKPVPFYLAALTFLTTLVARVAMTAAGFIIVVDPRIIEGPHNARRGRPEST